MHEPNEHSASIHMLDYNQKSKVKLPELRKFQQKKFKEIVLKGCLLLYTYFCCSIDV